MSSTSTKNCLRLASEIQCNRRPIDIPYDCCFLSRYTCIAIANASRLYYSEYMQLGHLYINLS
jgi:hypothetical protein